MKIVTRKRGSQRSSAPLTLTLEPNVAGQGGFQCLTFIGSDGRYYMIFPESSEDVKKLLSEVHVLHHNYEPEKT